ncbi:MSC_0775 family lipoprotein [Candidatus Mycoplasma pogonae]
MKKLKKLFTFTPLAVLSTPILLVACTTNDTTPEQPPITSNPDTGSEVSPTPPKNSSNQPNNETNSNEATNTSTRVTQGFVKNPNLAIEKFFELGLDKYVSIIKINDQLVKSRALARNLFNGGVLEANFRPHFDRSLITQAQQEQLDYFDINLNDFTFKFKYGALKVNPDNATEAWLPIEVTAGQRYTNKKKLYASRILNTKVTGFAKDPYYQFGELATTAYLEANPINISLKTDVKTSITEIIQGFNNIWIADYAPISKNGQEYLDAWNNLQKRRWNYLAQYFNISNTTPKALTFQIQPQTWLNKTTDSIEVVIPSTNIRIFVENITQDISNPNQINLDVRLGIKHELSKDEKLKKLGTMPSAERGQFYKNEWGKNVRLKQEITNSATSQHNLISFLTNDAQVYNKNYISPYNYRFVEKGLLVPLGDFSVKSQSDKVKYQIIRAFVNPEYSRSYIFTLLATSKDNSFEPQEVTVKFEVPKRGYIFAKSLQDSPIAYEMKIDGLKRQDLTQVTDSVNQDLGTKITTGGFLDDRNIYLAYQTYVSIHAGEDILVEAQTPVFAPFDGKVISSYYLPSETVGAGIGTQVIMEVNKTDLVGKLDQKVLDTKFRDVNKIYLVFIHLDYNTTLQLYGSSLEADFRNRRTKVYFNTITPQNPKLVKAGDIIGYVGAKEVNGGWTPHVHMELWDGNPIQLSQNGFTIDGRGSKGQFWSQEARSKYLESGKYDQFEQNSVFALKNLGTWGKQLPEIEKFDPVTLEKVRSPRTPGPKKYLPYLYNYETINTRFKPLWDPNYIIQLRDNNSLSFSVLDIFDFLEKKYRV